ncbi:antA/AntB antirepressor family protein [Gallibacterium anatis]|uniref:antA/AntB antirepressor family protein n=1 Tax=Gallibacterium anatis TaxID=750 RepID=UPI00211B6F6B|nr:antA/AntB antirepressor family protein [Gallibacterium anatis]WAX71586.1 antA/AntB antirepressor family protein [Gallibacterium anatis]
MTNSNLVTVFNGQIANQAVQLCNARDLHSFLEISSRYNDWISNRITDYGFTENEDYIIVTERTLGRPRKEYHITLDMGKELAMVERNEKGRQVRKYFIECERRAKELTKQQQPLPLAEAEADEEAIRIIANLYHSLNGAYEMGEKIRKEYPHLGRDIDKFIGGHYLYNLNMPTENALEKARKYVQAKSERIMFIKGMLSLLDEQPQPKRLNNF